MSTFDRQLAQCARSLATSLIHWARERDEDSKKRIAILQRELCLIYREEQSNKEHNT